MYRTSRFMDLAFEQALLALEAGELPVGCVVVAQNGGIVASAHNRTTRDRDPLAHAEILAIRQACEVLGTPYLTREDIYVTLEPCAMCAPAIARARLRRLYYAAFDPKMGATDHGTLFFENRQCCFHRPEVYGGIGQRRGTILLKAFFRNLRDGRARHSKEGEPHRLDRAEKS